jgi:hypothetical protein
MGRGWVACTRHFNTISIPAFPLKGEAKGHSGYDTLGMRRQKSLQRAERVHRAHAGAT